MKSTVIAFVAAAVLAHVASTARAHYLWVTVAPAGDYGTARIYFEEGPAARDGHYLDPFAEHGRTWVRTIPDPKPQPVAVRDTKEGEKRWLEGELPAAAPRSVESYGKFGVYRYGETDVLLHYYAKQIEVTDHDELHELGRAEQLTLDIVPHDDQGEMELTVLWQGEPAAGRTVYLRGPEKFQQNPTTDERGTVRFKPEAAGRYLVRTSVEEKDKGGEDGGQTYSETRHHATLIMNLPVGSK